MDVNGYRAIMTALAEGDSFCDAVSACDPGLGPRARSFAKTVEHARAELERTTLHELRARGTARDVDAELLRRPRLPPQISCDPIFIIGNRRSGTTLLAQILATSDDLVAVPEAFLAGTVIQSSELFAAGHLLRLTLGVHTDEFIVSLGAWVDRFYAEFARRSGARRWVAKELFCAKHLDLLDAIFDYRARFVYITRHGLDVAYSCAERFPNRNGLPVKAGGMFLQHYAQEWVDNNEATFDFYERVDDRVIRVRYEDLVSEPLKTASSVFEFIGERWKEDQMGRLGDRSLGMIGDNKFLATGGKVVASEGAGWQRWPVGARRTLGRLVNPTLQRLGYDILD